MKRVIMTLVVLLLTLPAWADEAHHRADALTNGEVRKVDVAAKKITIKHGPIQNLDMPAMTMVFQVKDPALLDQVKAGDMVKFRAEQMGETLTLTRIERAGSSQVGVEDLPAVADCRGSLFEFKR